MNNALINFFSIYHWFFVIGVFFLMILSAWLHIRHTLSFRSYRPMHWSSMVSINIVFIYGSIVTIIHHNQYQLYGIISWLSTLLPLTCYSFYKAMKVKIKLDKNNNILVPIFFFKLLLFVLIPYLLIYAPLLVYNPSFFYYAWFIYLSMVFKGFITGIYLGSTIASIYQVYERDMPAPTKDNE